MGEFDKNTCQNQQQTPLKYRPRLLQKERIVFQPFLGRVISKIFEPGKPMTINNAFALDARHSRRKRIVIIIQQ